MRMTAALLAVAAVFAVAAIMLLPRAPRAQQTAIPCGRHDLVMPGLAADGYMVVGQGIDAEGDLLEHLVKPSGEWVTVFTKPRTQVTCVLDYGPQWSPAPGKPDGAA